MASISFKDDTRRSFKKNKAGFQGLKHEQVFFYEVIKISGTSLTKDLKKKTCPPPQPLWLLNY